MGPGGSRFRERVPGAIGSYRERGRGVAELSGVRGDPKIREANSKFRNCHEEAQKKERKDRIMAGQNHQNRKAILGGNILRQENYRKTQETEGNLSSETDSLDGLTQRRKDSARQAATKVTSDQQLSRRWRRKVESNLNARRRKKGLSGNKWNFFLCLTCLNLP